ncbi:MAG: hypothetical protein Q9186_004302 [Xanthomendoza sp. 1 TL-2023]
MSTMKKLRCVVPLLIGVLSCIGASYCAHLLQHGSFYDTSYQFITILCWRNLDLTCGVLATSLPAIATLTAHHLPPSWKKYYTSDRSTPLKIYVGDQSNPLSSSKKLTSIATANQSERYDEIGGNGGGGGRGGGGGINVQHDIDLESLRGSEEGGYVKR